MKALQSRILPISAPGVRLCFGDKGCVPRECVPQLCLLLLRSQIAYLELDLPASLSDSMGDLASAIGRMETLRALKLSDTTLDVEHVTTISASPHITGLILSKCLISAGANAHAFESTLAASAIVDLHISDSDFVDNVLKRRSAVSLLHRVFDACSNVRTMKLHNVKLSDDACDSLVRLIREPQCALHSLVASGCTMSSRGHRMLQTASNEAAELGATSVEISGTHEIRQLSPNPFLVESRFSGAESGDWESGNASSGDEHAAAPGARARRTVHREITPITNCPHTDARHHAKGMCLPCYRRFRDRVNAGLERDTARRGRQGGAHPAAAATQHHVASAEYRSAADADDSGHSESGGEGKEDDEFVPSRGAGSGTPRRVRLGKIICCPHVNAKHHAKGMCLPCYRHARDRINAGLDRDFPTALAMHNLSTLPPTESAAAELASASAQALVAEGGAGARGAAQRVNRAAMKVWNCPHKEAKHHAKGMCLPCYRRKRERINAGLEPEFPAEAGLAERAARTTKRVRGGGALLESLRGGDSETGSSEEEAEREHDIASVASSNGSSDAPRRPLRRAAAPRRAPFLALSIAPSGAEADATSPSECSPSANLAEFSGLGIHSGSERPCGKRFRDRDSDLFRQYIVPRASGRRASEHDAEAPELEEDGLRDALGGRPAPPLAAADALRGPADAERSPPPLLEEPCQLVPLPVPLPAALALGGAPPGAVKSAAELPTPLPLTPAGLPPRPVHSIPEGRAAEATPAAPVLVAPSAQAVKVEARAAASYPEPGQAIGMRPELGPGAAAAPRGGRAAPYEVPRMHAHGAAHAGALGSRGVVAAFAEAERAREAEARQLGRVSPASGALPEGASLSGGEGVETMRAECASVPPSVGSSEDETLGRTSLCANSAGPSRGSSSRTPPAMVHLARVSGNAQGLVVSIPVPEQGMGQLLKYASLQFGREVVEVWNDKYSPVSRIDEIAGNGESVYYAITADDLSAA
eukprot:tig00000692_g3242.t1